MKRFIDDSGMLIGLDECEKVTLKKGSQVKSKSVTLDLNTEIILNSIKPLNIKKLMVSIML